MQKKTPLVGTLTPMCEPTVCMACTQWAYTGGHGGGSLSWWIPVPNTKVSYHSAFPLLREGQEGILEPQRSIFPCTCLSPLPLCCPIMHVICKH